MDWIVNGETYSEFARCVHLKFISQNKQEADSFKISANMPYIMLQKI